MKADDTLPKVAKYQDSHIMYNPTLFNSQPNTRIKFYDYNRKKREAEEPSAEDIPPVQSRESRGWCEDSFGVFCMLFNAVKGKIFYTIYNLLNQFISRRSPGGRSN